MIRRSRSGGAAATFRPAGSNAERTRLHNRRLVLGHVRAAGAVGRAEIARGSALSVQAVGNIVAELEAEGLLVEAGRRSGGRGLPAMQYAVNAAGGHALGVEIRPDALLFALIDLDGTPRFSVREPLARATPDDVASRLVALRERALGTLGIVPSTLLGAGIVMPGPFVETGLSGAASELPHWRGADARALFADALALDVVVENDANAAAMGERVSGAARRLDGYAFLYFGTGVGLGVVHEGRLFRGANGNAGEIGHVTLPGGRALEDVAGRLALRRCLAEGGLAADTAEAIEALHAAREPHLLAWLDEAIPAVAHAVAIVENLFDPGTVILGGALPDALLDEMIERLPLPDASVAMRGDRTVPRVLRGASGRMTAALGGAGLVVNRTFTPQLAALG